MASKALRAVDDEQDEGPQVVEVTLDQSALRWSDFIEIGKQLNFRVTMSMLSDPPIEVMIGLAWLELRKTRPGITYKEVAAMPISEMQIVPKS